MPSLTLDTGPEFTLESLRAMFGHPGFSALEYAGTEELAKKRTLSLKGKSTASTHEGSRTSNASTVHAESETSQPVVQELGSQQRRRGTFLNHTPRDYEVRSPKRSEFPRDSADVSNRAMSSTYNSVRQSDSTSGYPQHWQADPAASAAQDNGQVAEQAPVELDSKEVNRTTDRKNDSAAYSILRKPISSSRAIRPANRPVLSISTSPENRKMQASRSSQESRRLYKRQRRQTPFKVPSVVPIAHSKTVIGRYSPLEPLVAKHKREASAQSLGEVPPKVEIENIAEASTFRAIQEYFDSQHSTRSLASDDHHNASTAPTTLPSKITSEPQKISTVPIEPLSSTEQATAVVLTDLEHPLEPPPEIPARSPNRPNVLTELPIHTPSHSVSESANSNDDFESAAHGEYSPYDKKHDPDLNHKIIIPKRATRAPSYAPVGALAARAGSSTLGRMAPPIPRHEALTATTELNDLSYYLKNTGPSPEPQRPQRPQQRKGSGFKMFKVGGKKNLAARVGSVEGSPKRRSDRDRNSSRRAVSGAREMTTSAGVKHLQIIVPINKDLLSDQTITLPVSGTGSERKSRHVRISFTEEMLNPLASAELENVIAGAEDKDNGDDEIPTTPVRSPKSTPKSAKTTPVDEHPLLSREEMTRRRKLRDLQRVRQHSLDLTTESSADALAGATLTPSCSILRSKPPPPALQCERERQRRSKSLDANLNPNPNPNPESNPDPNSKDFANPEYTDSSDSDDEHTNRKDSAAYKMALLQAKVVFLQRQNMELAEALARVVGVVPEEGEKRMDAQTVLDAYRGMRAARKEREGRVGGGK